MNKIPSDRYFPLGMGHNEQGIEKEESGSLSEKIIIFFQSIFPLEILIKTKENSGETICIYKSSANNYLKSKIGHNFDSSEFILKNLEVLKQNKGLSQREPTRGTLTVKDEVETTKKSVSWGGNVRDSANTISKPKVVSATRERQIYERTFLSITTDEAEKLGKLNERIVKWTQQKLRRVRKFLKILRIS